MNHTVSDIPIEIQSAIKSTTDKNGKFSGTKYKKLSDTVHSWFDKNSEWMSPKALFYLLKNGLNELPFCEYCQTVQLTAKQYEWSYKKDHHYCCPEHASKSAEVREKINKSWEKFGGAPFKSQDVIEKRRQTWNQKYGGNNPISDPKVLEKYRQTCLERYGVDNISKLPSTVSKSKETLKEHYGVDTPIKNSDLEQKRRNTWLKIYGVEHPCKTQEVQEKQKQTWFNHYGVEHMSQAESVRQKIKTAQRTTLWDSRLKIAQEMNLEILSSKENYIEGKPFTYKCLTCGTIFETEDGPSVARCLTCFPKHAFVSKKETEVADWIRSIYTGTVETSNRSLINPFELDIYIPDKHLAVEFDGMYWHSDRFKEKDYHQKKSILCIEKGVRLIHVPELVWDKRTRFIKSIIKNALGLTENKIYARDTQITEIDSLSYRIFLNENHMQGAIDSKYKYGLLYNGDLVSVMGFGDSRFKKNEQELHRFCSKLDWNVVGGFQKLLKHSGFHGVSYVDLNYFDGSGYKEAGFEFVSYTEPSYVWLSCETGMIYSRYQTQKHKLAKLLEFFEPTLSETDNMLLNGYIKIYDSGTMKLKYE